MARLLVQTAQAVGSHVAPAAWLFLVAEQLTSARASPAQKTNGLVVLAGLLYGAGAAGRRLGGADLQALADTLCSEEVRGVPHLGVRTQLLSAVTNTIAMHGAACRGVSLQLYHVLLQIQAVQQAPDLRANAAAVTRRLAEACGCTDASELSATHSRTLLQAIASKQEAWGEESPDRFVFGALLQNCSEASLTALMDQLIPLFRSCLDQERDPHMRLEMLQLLDKLIDDPAIRGAFKARALPFLREVLMPPLVWRVGKTAAAVRFYAIVALGSFFRHGLISRDLLVDALTWSQPAVLPNVHSCLEEDYYADTRQATCHVMDGLLRIVAGKLTYDQKRLIYAELLKRLDDSNDAIRIAATKTLTGFFDAMADFDATNVGYIVDGMLIHMDDMNAEVQEAVCQSLLHLATLHPGVVKVKVTEARDKHRAGHFCDRCLAEASKH